MFSHIWEEYLAHQSQVMYKLLAASLTVILSKYQVGRTYVQYLGHQVGGGTLISKTGNVKIIMTWPTPQTKKWVMSFPGTFS